MRCMQSRRYADMYARWRDSALVPCVIENQRAPKRIPSPCTAREPMSEPKLLDQVRQTARLKHFSLRTERAYTQWVYRFVVHHGKRHPRDMGAREIQAFLTWLAVERNVA